MLDTIPDSIILHIFNYLSPMDVGRAGQCNMTLRRVAHDDLLWRAFFHRYFRVTPFFKEPIGYDTWRSEFIRLVDETPVMEAQVLTRHSDQVLHVSFSKDGTRFATTAKDAFIYVWKSNHPVTLEFGYCLKRFSWKYTQFSQFNESNTLLLVSGVLFGLQSTSGEIVVFGLNDGFQIRCRVINKPYDVFGSWYSDNYFLSGDLKWLGNLVSKSVIWLNKASQEVESEHAAIMNQIFRFYNPKASSIRTLLVANCVETPESSEHSSPVQSKKTSRNIFDENAKRKFERVGNPPSHFNVPLERDLMRINSRGMRGTLQGAFQNWKPIDNVSDIGYSAEFHKKSNRERERERQSSPRIGSDSGDGQQPCSSKNMTRNSCLTEEKTSEAPSQKRLKSLDEYLSSSRHALLVPDSSDLELDADSSCSNSTGIGLSNCQENEELSSSSQKLTLSPARTPEGEAELNSDLEDEQEETKRYWGYRSSRPSKGSLQESRNEEPCTTFPKESEEDEIIDPREKLLIFTCGSETYTPHQVGFKRISPMKFKSIIDRGPGIGERLKEYRRRKRREENNEVEEVDYSNFNSVADRFDPIDCVLDMHGHIIGLTLSPDHRYLYVNSRPWPAGYTINEPLSPPPIAQEIDIHVIDLVTLRQVGMMRRAHRAYTPNEECFFIFLDASDYYLASGAEDKFGYLWDRHYGISLTKLPHTDVVNAVAFNPVESEMLVSVSDDNTIKIWRSASQCRALGLDCKNLVQGTKLYLKPRPSCFPGPSNSI